MSHSHALGETSMVGQSLSHWDDILRGYLDYVPRIQRCHRETNVAVAPLTKATQAACVLLHSHSCDVNLHGNTARPFLNFRYAGLVYFIVHVAFNYIFVACW